MERPADLRHAASYRPRDRPIPSGTVSRRCRRHGVSHAGPRAARLGREAIPDSQAGGKGMSMMRWICCGMMLALTGMVCADEPKPKAPFPYVWAKAYHIPPETTTEESGYFSLCEGKNG